MYISIANSIDIAAINYSLASTYRMKKNYPKSDVLYTEAMDIEISNYLKNSDALSDLEKSKYKLDMIPFLYSNLNYSIFRKEFNPEFYSSI